MKHVLVKEGIINEYDFHHMESFEGSLKSKLMTAFIENFQYGHEYKVTLEKRKEQVERGVKVRFTLTVDDGLKEQSNEHN